MAYKIDGERIMQYATGKIDRNVQRVWADYVDAWSVKTDANSTYQAHIYHVWESLLALALYGKPTDWKCGYCGGTH